MYVTIPHGNTYVASDILLTLDYLPTCSGCHLRRHFATTPSTNLSIPLSLRDFPLPLRPSEKERGECLYRIHEGSQISDPGAVALVSSQNAPECTLQSLMEIRMSQATSSSRSITYQLAAVVICDATLQRPLPQTSPSPCHFVTSPFLSSLSGGRGTYQTTFMGVGAWNNGMKHMLRLSTSIS